MTRILVQRGSTGSSSSSSDPNRSSVSLPGSSSSSALSQPHASTSRQVPSAPKDDELAEELQESIAVDALSINSFNHEDVKDENASLECFGSDRGHFEEKIVCNEKICDSGFVCGASVKGSNDMGVEVTENEGNVVHGAKGSCPLSPPVPPPKPTSLNSSPRKFSSGSSDGVQIGPSREIARRPNVSTRTSPTGSRPSSLRSHYESEGYNSADEQNPNFGSSCGDAEPERDHFSQFIIEGFTSYCKRKRRDKQAKIEKHRV